MRAASLARPALSCPVVCSELLSNVAVESGEDEDIPSISVSTASTAYSLIETSHVVFNKVKKLWNSNQESHREVRGDGWMALMGM